MQVTCKMKCKQIRTSETIMIAASLHALEFLFILLVSLKFNVISLFDHVDALYLPLMQL